MSEESIKNLEKMAKRIELLDYQRDLLILRSSLDGDKMTDVARAARLSRTHIYRIRDEVVALYEAYMEDTTDAEFWERANAAWDWRDLRNGSKA